MHRGDSFQKSVNRIIERFACRYILFTVFCSDHDPNKRKRTNTDF